MDAKPCRGMQRDVLHWEDARGAAGGCSGEPVNSAKEGFNPEIQNRGLVVAVQTTGATPGRAGWQPPPWLWDRSSWGTWRCWRATEHPQRLQEGGDDVWGHRG